MTPSHAETYSTLTVTEAGHLWARVHEEGLLSEPPPDRPSGETLAQMLAPLSHAEVVLTLARDTSLVGMSTVEKLIARPIYMAARGETGEALTDIHGRPLPLPLGHRRGEPPSTGSPSLTVRRRLRHATERRDNRVITRVAPNPKRYKSGAWERYQLYRVGLTVDEVVALGVTRADVRWDTARGFIDVERPERGGRDSSEDSDGGGPRASGGPSDSAPSSDAKTGCAG